MPNERLRDALLRNGLTFGQVANAIKVDPKTVERWVTKDRTPYPRHRHAIATMAREPENYLWPDAIAPERKTEIGNSVDHPGDLGGRWFWEGSRAWQRGGSTRQS